MKTTFKCIILVFIALLFTGCPEMDYKCFFRFYNHSDTNVYVHLEYIPRKSYPDTLPKPLNLTFGPVKQQDYRGISFNKLQGQDSLFIFILEDNPALYSGYKILQIYNLTLKGLSNFNAEIYYPPTKK